MLGLGSNMMKHPVTGKSIVRDGLVLQHNYNLSSVEPLSSGAADINADAAANEYIDVGAIPITTNDVTMSAWVYVTEFVDYAGVISNRSNGGAYQGVAIRTLNENTFSLAIDEETNGLTSSISGVKNINQWYHVCGVMDRDGSQYLYVDGVLEDSDDISNKADSLTHTTNAFIGQNYGGTEFRGYICNVGYWNRVLDQDEIKSIMNKNYDSLSASEKTDLVSWWNLDETLGDKGIVLDNNGAIGENLLTNADFANGQDDWAGFGSVYTTLLNGVVTLDGTSGVAQLGQNILTNGSTYEVEFTITDHNGDATNSEIIQNNGGSLFAIPGNGVYKIHFTLAYANGTLTFRAKTGSKFSISNISVKLVNGNTGTLS
jgi:hypothetical protein